MNYLDFSGKKIMIVGASSGIGRTCAVLLSELGAELILVARDEEKLNKTMELIASLPGNNVLPCDVSDFEQYDHLFNAAVIDGKKLDGLVYCAGVAKPVPLRVISYEEYERVFAVNYFGFLRMVQYYTRKKYNCGGSIVGVSAINAHYPQECMTIYAASKSAMEASVRTLAVELSRQGIRINTVIPGAVDTQMLKTIGEKALERIISKQLLGLQKPEAVADLIAFLLSSRASSITGRNLFVDGGMLGQ